MKPVLIMAFVLGLLVTGFSWVISGVPSGLFFIGFSLILESYLLLLIFLYKNKINVYSRGGLIKYVNNPWLYRFYFFILVIPWVILNIILLSKYLAFSH